MFFDTQSCTFVLVDVQEKLTPLVYDPEKLLNNCSILLDAARILEIPVLWLEQYPRGLGHTVEVLAQRLNSSSQAVEKIAFSGCHEEACKNRLRDLGRDQCVVMGIEAHVCVYQTVIDLLAEGKQVQVVVNAVSSRDSANKSVALRRMEQEGARLTTVEMILFELLRGSKHHCFKEIQGLIK
jgi:nicotinamidase-related amidase